MVGSQIPKCTHQETGVQEELHITHKEMYMYNTDAAVPSFPYHSLVSLTVALRAKSYR